MSFIYEHIYAGYLYVDHEFNYASPFKLQMSACGACITCLVYQSFFFFLFNRSMIGVIGI
jgi:hypothetical protein